MRILLIGDVVGKGGRKAVRQLVPELRKEFNCAFCIANGENVAGGAGLTESTVLELKAGGVDVVTSGDHVWDQHDFAGQIDRLPFVLRPANLQPGQPGRGYGVYNIPIGGQVAVINVVGRVFVSQQSDCPFHAVERILEELRGKTPIIFVDIHAEATSEKIALARFLAGKVTAVFGTHTHVATADEQVLAGGTAYISDLGMVGARDSILGRDIQAVVSRFYTGMPSRFLVVDKGIELRGAVVEFDRESGRATSIERVTRQYD